MESFSALLAIVRGIHRSLHKGQWRRALMFTLICGRINDLVINREAGDLRRVRVHYNVIVMIHWSLRGKQVNWVITDWHLMMTSSNGTIFRVTGPLCGEFPAKRPVARSFGVFFDLCVNKRLSKQSWCWWFETLSRSFWRHHNVILNHGNKCHWHLIKM